MFLAISSSASLPGGHACSAVGVQILMSCSMPAQQTTMCADTCIDKSIDGTAAGNISRSAHDALNSDPQQPSETDSLAWSAYCFHPLFAISLAAFRWHVDCYHCHQICVGVCVDVSDTLRHTLSNVNLISSQNMCRHVKISS